MLDFVYISLCISCISSTERFPMSIGQCMMVESWWKQVIMNFKNSVLFYYSFLIFILMSKHKFKSPLLKLLNKQSFKILAEITLDITYTKLSKKKYLLAIQTSYCKSWVGVFTCTCMGVLDRTKDKLLTTLKILF